MSILRTRNLVILMVGLCFVAAWAFAKKRHANPIIHIYVDDCLVVEQKVHASGKPTGSVEFVVDGSAPITLSMKNVAGGGAATTAFGMPSLSLNPGSTVMDITINPGSPVDTQYTFDCFKGGKKTPSDPSDIIVP